MSRYKYTAKDMQGKTRRGTLEAANEGALTTALREQNLYLMEARNLTEKTGYKKLKPKQLAGFCRQLSTLLTAGISLVRALDIISEQDGMPDTEREVYLAVLSDLKRGISLSEAMETKACFPDLMIGMIRSGEGSGNLDRVTDRLATQYEKDYKLTQQVRSAMTYPLILLILCVGIVILIVTFILPQFQSLFDQMESLPAITNVLIAVSDFFVNRWYVALIVVFAAVVIIRLMSHIRSIRRFFGHVKIALPGLGKLFKTIYTARFARTLSSLYSSGMPLAGAIRTAGQTVGNIYIEEQFEGVVTRVRGGVPLSRALREVDGLMPKLASTIMVGEESGQLDVMLDSIAESLDVEAEQAIKRLVTLIEPVMIIVMAVIVGLIMIGVMLPIYQSYAAIENA